MEEENEYLLVEKAKSDPEAFGKLYDRYFSLVYGYVVKRVRFDREAAEDITSLTFEKALRSIKSLKQEVSFKAWILRIAGNNVVDYHRMRRIHTTIDLSEIGELVDEGSLDELESVDNRIVAREAFDLLPESQRIMLTLRYLEGLSMNEMADVLGLNETSCYMRVYRATKAFTRMLDKKGIERGTKRGKEKGLERTEDHVANAE